MYVDVVVTATPEIESESGGKASDADTPTGDQNVPLPPSNETEEAPTETGEEESENTANSDTSGEGSEAAGTNNTISGEADAALAPPPAELGRIAYMGPNGGGGTFHAFVANVDGTGLKFPSSSLSEGFFPHLSPDGSLVAFTAPTIEGDPDIFVTEVTGGDPTNLTNKPGQDIQPIWSPDGSQIAFVSEREGGDIDIWVMDADGSNARRLAHTPGEDVLGSWNPDGSQIVYSNRTEIGESLWIIDVESGETTKLTENDAGTEGSPDWSPDGERIAYYATEEGAPPQIFTIKPDGSDIQQITAGATPAVFPIWSPDGAWLVYSLIQPTNDLEIVALNLETEEVHPIPDVNGLATSWRAASEALTDTGVTQGPKQTEVEVDPAILEAAYKRGDPDAPVTIVEFSDYQCPFCQRWFESTLPQLEPYIEDGTVQLIYVDFPLNIHPQAPAAAQAARCAGEQGGDEAYWTMHDALFNSISQWSGQSQPAPIFAEVATEAGLDGEELQACVESGRYADEVQAGLQEGIRLGVTGTPTFFINGERLVGAQPLDAFEPYLQ